jgi:Domain of unknown function (DUF4189)
MPVAKVSVTTKLSAIALVLMFFAEIAVADGALVVGVPANGLRAGFAYSETTNADTPTKAIEDSIAGCREGATKQNLDGSLCKLVESFKDKCVAIAMDATNKWAGWAVLPRKDAAEKAALANCRKGGSACKIYESACDGNNSN